MFCSPPGAESPWRAEGLASFPKRMQRHGLPRRSGDLMQDVLEEARLVAGSTPGAVVAASIIVMDDDAEIVREWELDGEP